jgi:ABC-2 type transport system permease protein
VNIFFRELRANTKSLLVWSIIIALFSVVGFSKFQAYYGNPEMLEVLDAMPPAMLAAFNLNAFNLTTITGFLGVMAAYNALMLSISAVLWGSGVIAREERDKTVEYSLTLPVTRERVVIAKTAAMVVCSAILLLVTWGSMALMSRSYAPDDAYYRYLALNMISYFIMQMIFLSVGVLMGSAMKRHKLSGSTALWVLLGTYFLSVVIGLNSDLDKLKYLTPFKYFDPAQMLRDGRLETGYIFLSAGIFIICLAGALVAYRRRDLYI